MTEERVSASKSPSIFSFVLSGHIPRDNSLEGKRQREHDSHEVTIAGGEELTPYHRPLFQPTGRLVYAYFLWLYYFCLFICLLYVLVQVVNT